MRNIATGLFGLALVSLQISVAWAEETSDPAVSNLNISGLVMGGVDDADSRVLAGVKATFPLGHSFGMQIDGGIANADYFGVGGHLFWRDPAFGLLGAVGSVESQDGRDLIRVGAEAELYLGQFTIAGLVGYEDGPRDQGVYGEILGTFYPVETLALRAGGEITPELLLGRLAFEWQPMADELEALSIFATAEYTDVQTGTLLGGIRFHLGEDGVSLMRRERHEDPQFAIFNILPVSGAASGAPGAPPPPECTPEQQSQEICFIGDGGEIIFIDNLQ